MDDRAPSREEWTDLYQAALEFKGIDCWDWMYDSDMFGVQDPSSGEIGYCCVMGSLGEHYALGVYLGTEGLEGYNKIQSGAFEPPGLAALHAQKCLMASFEDREFLEQQDRSVIKELGLKFRGRNAWPLFRDYRPGYFPWFVTGAQARYLTLVLRQAIDVALRLKDDANLLTPPRRGRYLVCVAEQRDGGLSWSDQWLAPAPIESEAVALPQPDELRVQRIKQTIAAKRGAWEADFFFAPSPVQERKADRPFFPQMSMWVDRGSGQIIHADMAEMGEHRGAFQDQCLTLIEQARFMPKELYVKQPEALALLEPIAKRLGIKLKQAPALPMLDDARASMASFFQGF